MATSLMCVCPCHQCNDCHLCLVVPGPGPAMTHLRLVVPGPAMTHLRLVVPGPAMTHLRLVVPGPAMTHLRLVVPGPAMTHLRLVVPGPAMTHLCTSFVCQVLWSHLKKYNFFYMFGFPALSPPTPVTVSSVVALKDVWSQASVSCECAGVLVSCECAGVLV